MYAVTVLDSCQILTVGSSFGKKKQFSAGYVFSFEGCVFVFFFKKAVLKVQEHSVRKVFAWKVTAMAQHVAMIAFGAKCKIIN